MLFRGLFFTALCAIVALANLYLYRKADRFVAARAPRWRGLVAVWFCAINSPLLFIAAAGIFRGGLTGVPLEWLKWLVYPFFAWVATVMFFLLVAVPADLIAGAARGIARRFRSQAAQPTLSASALSRRGFLTGTAAVIPPLLYGISIKGVYGPHTVDIAPQRTIPIPGLPASLDGMTITQVSDLHTGAYTRGPELDQLVATLNGLRGDLIAITGDFMDNSLDLLDVARQSLSRLRAPMGVFGILGNHDYYSDRLGPHNPGCLHIMAAMQQAGIQMLRNSHTQLGGTHGLILGGVDWIGSRRGNPNAYDSPATRVALQRTFAGSDPALPRVLLAHHPHVFFDSPDFGAAFTLAGHTHGGGQVVVAEIDGVPLAVGTPIFRYISGYYSQGASALYVNRGFGYVGIPIRLNCPPEISRFKLTRA